MGDSDKDIRTKMEYLYDDILGEVREIVGLVETLRANVEATSTAAAERISAAADDKTMQLLQAADAMRAAIDSHAAQKMQQIELTLDQLKQDIRAEVHNGAMTGTAAAFDAAMDRKTAKAVDSIRQTDAASAGISEKLDSHLKAMGTAAGVLRNAAADVKPTGKSRALLFVGIFLAVAFGVAAGAAMKSAVIDTHAATVTRMPACPYGAGRCVY